MRRFLRSLSCRWPGRAPGARSALAAVGAVLLGALAGCSSDNTVIVSADQVAPNTVLAREENERAYELIEKGDYAGAEEAARKALAADRNFGPAMNNLGLVLMERRQYREAAQAFNEAKKLLPDSPDVRNNLGLLLWGAAEAFPNYLAAAITEFEQAHRMAPENPQFLQNLVEAKIERGDADEQTLSLLGELAFRTPSAPVREWARMQAIRLRARQGSGEAPAAPGGGAGTPPKPAPAPGSTLPR